MVVLRYREIWSCADAKRELIIKERSRRPSLCGDAIAARLCLSTFMQVRRGEIKVTP